MITVRRVCKLCGKLFQQQLSEHNICGNCIVAPTEALCPSPAHLQSDAELLAGVRARRAKRSGMARAIKKKKGDQ